MTEVHRRNQALLDRVAAAADSDGRLALPDVASWDIFPFEGELLVKRLEPAGVGRVHVMKVGDGSEHLHVWFFARPEGLLQLRGSSLSDWTDCLPPMPTDEWDAVARALAVRLAETGGRALG